jgi:hypothetical protein
MKATLQIINQMKADGIIGKYAIGGAVGATFYLEPSATLDIDVFVSLKEAAESSLLTLAPIYHYLTARGCPIKGEYLFVEGWQVQFLPPSDALGEEALAQAIQTQVDDVPTWIMTAEHLVALALQLGRPKDQLRILQFVEAGILDPQKLDPILARHQLLDKWEDFGHKFLRNR